MKDKELIEEMAQCKNFLGMTCSKCEVRAGCDRYTLAEELYEQGYRKLPEDSVVLSREGYEKLQKRNADRKRLRNKIVKYKDELNRAKEANKNLLDLFKIEIDKASKETAEKIFTEVLDLEQLKVIRDMGWENVYNTLYNEILELAKQFGVEIKE